jgi:hypothetical protein
MTIFKSDGNRRHGYLAIGLCCLIMAMLNLFDPKLSRPSGGRWSYFFALIWDMGGAFGIQIYWFLLAILFFCFFLWSKK